MTSYSPDRAADFIKALGHTSRSERFHQITRSFLDGIYGHGYIAGSSFALIVFDIVQCFGPFNDELLGQILTIEEAHIFDPPADWIGELGKRFPNSYKLYTRTAFAAYDFSQFKEEKFVADEISIQNEPVSIKPITDELVVELQKEAWSKDIVANTMAPPLPLHPGFGFVAMLGKKIIGGIGCYTMYGKGIEIQVDTHADYRRRGIALALSRRMIAECGKRNLECHWDAMNQVSAKLAEKIGFRRSREYKCIQLKNS